MPTTRPTRPRTTPAATSSSSSPPRWCPTCQRADKNLKGSGVPEGLTVVKTDYDSSSALKKQYGVTVQHTFVQVDPSGEALAKFTGSDTAEEIAGKTV